MNSQGGLSTEAQQLVTLATKEIVPLLLLATIFAGRVHGHPAYAVSQEYAPIDVGLLAFAF